MDNKTHKPSVKIVTQESPMVNVLRRLSGSTSNTAIRAKGTNDPFTLWELNMAHAAPLLTTEATIVTQRFYEELNGSDDVSLEKDMDVLDYISKFYIAYHVLAVQDRKDALAGFVELYSYLKTERSKEIYAYYTAAFIQAFYCYIYTSASMGMGIPKGLNNETAHLTDAYHIMSQLSDETRRKVYEELNEQGAMPGTANIASLKKSIPKFTEIITAEQQNQKNKQSNKS